LFLLYGTCIYYYRTDKSSHDMNFMNMNLLHVFGKISILFNWF
jgi:hypothetical protein